jgi:hypothetical protein
MSACDPKPCVGHRPQPRRDRAAVRLGFPEVLEDDERMIATKKTAGADRATPHRSVVREGRAETSHQRRLFGGRMAPPFLRRAHTEADDRRESIRQLMKRDECAIPSSSFGDHLAAASDPVTAK